MGDAVSGGSNWGESYESPVYVSQTYGDKDILVRFLDTNGDGSGSTDGTGNFSSAARVLYAQPPSDKKFIIVRLIVYLEDSGTIDSGFYGNGIELTNGVSIRHSRSNGSTLINDITAGMPVMTNTEWKSHCFDLSFSDFGSGNASYSVRWTFSKTGQRGFVLDGSQNDRFEVILNDNLNGLVAHRFKVEGYIEDV